MLQNALWKDESEGRFFTRLLVTDTLSGSLVLPLHVVTGRKDGPTLGITATIHGDETVPAIMLRHLFGGLDLSQLSGRVCAIPVCNPPAMSAFGRQTPEQHGKTDLHEVFPGSAKGNLTQMIAASIASNLIDHVDVLIDYHCGGSGGRLQERVDIHRGAADDLKARSFNLARQFGTVFAHENNLAGTAVGYANSLGKPAFNAETAGVYLHPEDAGGYIDAGVGGFRNVMKSLGMLPGSVDPLPRQLQFTPESRKEVNPTRGGYLESFFQRPDELGTRVAQGTILGRLVDMYSLEVVEELVAPVDGYLFFSRYSGVVDAGTKAFALAEEASSQWLD
jgi:predicted deacylase